ncbi:MAG: Rrf2 family transcriptional regulator [Treponema sp.]|jgi:Rrf2 family iron-sulfur cluster assembly transcriptional regulator|nr:Rrf2 family transcriptional regulator [Treponema sp.]
MKITTKGRYALRATLALADLGANGEPVSINNLSQREGISPIFLEQIFFRLRKSGIVDSVRGPGGGFHFAKTLDEITLRDILEASGENLSTNVCKKNTGNCFRADQCLSHAVWEKADALLNEFFGTITLAEILQGDWEKK